MKLGTASDVAVVYAAETTQARQSADFVALSQRMRLDEFNTLSMTAGSSMATDNILSIYMSFTRAFGASMPGISELPDAVRLIRVPQNDRWNRPSSRAVRVSTVLFPGYCEKQRQRHADPACW